MERMVSEDLAYNILHCVNSLANNLIGPLIPHPALAPVSNLATLLLPPWVEFASSHICNEPVDFPHPENYNILLNPLVHLAGISWAITLSTLTWSVGVHWGTSFPYAKDGPDHELQFIGVNTVGCLCIASSKHILGQLLHCKDCLPNHEEHDSWREGPVMTLGHNTSHGLSRRVIFFSFLSLAWLHHRSADGIATDTSSLCFLLVLLFLLLWSLCSSPNKAQLSPSI